MQAELEGAVLECLRADTEGTACGDSASVARFIVTTINGLAVSARMGNSRAELENVTRIAVTALAKT